MMLKNKKFFAVIAASCLVFGMAGCQQNDVSTGQADTEQTVSETQQIIAATEQTEQTFKNVETSETETSAESEDNTEKTVTIAGQEFSVDETDVRIFIDNGMEFVTDISELSKLKNLKWLIFTNISDGGPYSIDGLKALEGSESLEYIDLGVGLANEEDIHILETMPNLKSLSLYGVYDDFEFDLPSLKYLHLVGAYDLSKIEHLTWLKHLYLEYNNGDDLSPIAKLKNLRGLKIEECFFEDYSSILELENLENLWISSRPMTEEMYNKICEKFPDCNITIMNDFID